MLLLDFTIVINIIIVLGCNFETDNVAFAVNFKALQSFILYEGKMFPLFSCFLSNFLTLVFSTLFHL